MSETSSVMSAEYKNEILTIYTDNNFDADIEDPLLEHSQVQQFY